MSMHEIVTRILRASLLRCEPRADPLACTQHPEVGNFTYNPLRRD